MTLDEKEGSVMAKAVARPREPYWRELTARWERSGLTRAEFCRRESVSPGTFSWWRHELKRRDAEAARGNGKGPAFVPVRVVDYPARSSTRSTMEVVLRGGRLVRIQTELGVEDLAKMVLALEGRAC